jgi:quinol monooxygenase YgiN
MPWKTIAKVEGSREYLALLSYLPLKKYRMIPRFLQFSFQIQRQLNNSPGVVGYSLRAKPLRRNFWTLSVWEDEKALQDFVRKVPHLDAMTSLIPHMGPTRFSQWRVVGSSLPLHWDDAMRRWSQGT